MATFMLRRSLTSVVPAALAILADSDCKDEGLPSWAARAPSLERFTSRRPGELDDELGEVGPLDWRRLRWATVSVLEQIRARSASASSFEAGGGDNPRRQTVTGDISQPEEKSRSRSRRRPAHSGILAQQCVRCD
jgi:hypothetical protein